MIAVCAGCGIPYRTVGDIADERSTHGICDSCMKALYPPGVLARVRARRESDTAILSLPGCPDDCAPCSDAAATEFSADGAERPDGRYGAEEL